MSKLIRTLNGYAIIDIAKPISETCKIADAMCEVGLQVYEVRTHIKGNCAIYFCSKKTADEILEILRKLDIVHLCGLASVRS